VGTSFRKPSGQEAFAPALPNFMSALVEAARGLLERAREQRLLPGGALAMAAAGAVVEAAGPDSAFRAAERFRDRGLALLVAGAAEALHPAGRQEWLAALARAIPSEDRMAALACAERFLARVGAAWAAALTEELIGAQAICSHGALGLYIAARADADGTPVPAWVAGPPENRPLYARQLAADTTARAAARGRITSADHPALAPLREKPPGRFLLPTEASAYLAAAVALDPARALDIADGLLQTHTPADMEEALQLAAEAAVRAGLAESVAARARRPGFIAEQACWAQAAARSGALEPEAILTLALELAPRVADELDPDRELIAGMPLLTALAHAGAADALLEAALAWRTPPPLLADQLFYNMARRGAAELLSREGFDRLLRVPEDEWNATYDYEFGWWLDSGFDSETRLLACRDVLALAADPPWSVIPGSLEDMLMVES
jgi:hypothetical protein